MIHATKRIAGGAGLAAVLVKRAPTLELDWDTRSKSRFAATDSTGREIGVVLPRGTALRGGDVLVAEDGTLLRVVAAAQPVLQVRHCAEHGSPFDLLRAAYHLGNRHVPLELSPELLQFEPDAVLADMLRRQHLIVTEAQAAFEPEGGAYGEGGGHGHHHHGHDHGHDHAHEHHGHAAEPPARKPLAIPVKAHDEGHVHGPGCGHDHGHDHKH
ncbi:urease accessory protein UreE [Roseateles saccharophilus]|uniref:Urease accessory protein UreE n=1 Tax=Roseateles saccharophilus TaxID=304 RepID=A0A4R3UF24_ROSSA|nr:urease accessory protein UreE [Roseateles saccharophilus]MDG0835039.1 urease accessory protein UreE [Roseateles saccharophilus]TCU88317.1 urease accessory protein [Roseateles saccharophilus]